ncbi:MAG: PAS domain S-box protein [Vicinamibacterales bacterium]
MRIEPVARRLPGERNNSSFTGTLLEQAYDAIFVRDEDGRITLWNAGAERMYGWSAAEATGAVVHDLLQTPADIRAEFTAALRSGTWSGQIQHRHRDGHAVISDSRQVRLASSQVLEVNRDVTDRVQAERALFDSQQLLRTMLDDFPTSIAFKDREGRFIDVNPAVERSLGIEKSAIVGRTIETFIPAEAAAISHQHDQQVMASRQAHQYEEATPLPSGTQLHLNTSFPLIGADGYVYGTGHISHDITTQKRAQMALEASEQTLKALMDASTESIWLLDRERVLVANTTAAERLGLAVSELVGASWRNLFPEENRQAARREGGAGLRDRRARTLRGPAERHPVRALVLSRTRQQRTRRRGCSVQPRHHRAAAARERTARRLAAPLLSREPFAARGHRVRFRSAPHALDRSSRASLRMEGR